MSVHVSWYVSALTLLWLLENASFCLADYLSRRRFACGYGGFVIGALGVVVVPIFNPFVNTLDWPYGTPDPMSYRALSGFLWSGMHAYFAGTLLAFVVHQRAASGAPPVPYLATLAFASLLGIFFVPLDWYGEAWVQKVFWKMAGLLPIFAVLVVGLVEGGTAPTLPPRYPSNAAMQYLLPCRDGHGALPARSRPCSACHLMTTWTTLTPLSLEPITGETSGAADPMAWLLARGYLPLLGKHLSYTTYLLQAPVANFLMGPHMTDFVGYPERSSSSAVFAFGVLLPVILFFAALLNILVQQPAVTLYSRMCVAAAASPSQNAAPAALPA
jgi:hypothetical protein